MKNLSQEQKGELYIIVEAILWGFFPILALKSFNQVPPIMSAALCQLVSMLALATPVYKTKGLKPALKKEALFPILGSTILVGVMFYALVFIASKSSDPVTISILLLFEVPATYIILRLFGKEKLSNIQMFGGALVMLSSILVLYNGSLAFRLTDLLVILGVFIAPMGNYYNKVARQYVNAYTFVFLRNLFSGIILVFLSVIFESKVDSQQIYNSLYYILPNGILVFGLSKILWVEGLHRITIGKAISLNSIFPVITMLASFIFMSYSPSLNQIVALVPGIYGVYLLTLGNKGRAS